MKVVVYGLSQIGKNLAVFFSESFFDVIVIDEDQAALDALSAKFDIQTKCGNGASVSSLEQAEINGVDLFIAASRSDEKNILAAHFAKSVFKAKYSSAYLVHSDFMTHTPQEFLQESGLDIDRLISSEKIIRSVSCRRNS